MSKRNIVYLDNNSTTELSHEVSGVLMDIVIHSVYGNPSSKHSFGLKMRAIVEASRYSVAKSLGCGPGEIYFTSGGTEANNMAIRGVYNIYSDQENEAVMSIAEHSSVYNTMLSVVQDSKVRQIPLLSDGSLDLEWADRLITEDTTLVSVMLANNETGNIYPVKEIVRIAHERGALVHCDAVQAYGKMPINVRDLGVDILTISGHKAHALPGIGALYVRKGVQVHPISTGGNQEMGMRPGTENYIAIATLGTVAEEIYNRESLPSPGLRDVFERGLLRQIPDIFINGAGADRIYNTSSVTFRGIDASQMVEALSDNGIFASTGPACSAGLKRTSRTLESMGLSEDEVLSTVRFSFSQFSSISDVVTAIEGCARCAKVLRGQSPE